MKSDLEELILVKTGFKYSVYIQRNKMSKEQKAAARKARDGTIDALTHPPAASAACRILITAAYNAN